MNIIPSDDGLTEDIQKIYAQMEELYYPTMVPTRHQVVSMIKSVGPDVAGNIMYHIVNSKTPEGHQVVKSPMGFMVKTCKSSNVKNYTSENYTRRKTASVNSTPMWMEQLKEKASAGGYKVAGVEDDSNLEYQQPQEVTNQDINWLFSANHSKLYKEDPSRLMWLYRAGTAMSKATSLQRYYPYIFGRPKAVKASIGRAREWVSKYTETSIE